RRRRSAARPKRATHDRGGGRSEALARDARSVADLDGARAHRLDRDARWCWKCGERSGAARRGCDFTRALDAQVSGARTRSVRDAPGASDELEMLRGRIAEGAQGYG